MEEKKLTDELDYYFTTFDEQGYQPTVTMPCMDAELLAKSWKSGVLDLIHRLQDENKYLKTCCDQFLADYKKELAEHEEFALKAKAEIERLTEEKYQLEQNLKQCENGYKQELHIERYKVGELQKQVKEYQDKIEQGTLIELPCKVGDTVYCVYAATGVQEWEVRGIQISENTILFLLGHKGTDDYNAAHLSEKGRYLFFTREEAEKRLKELQE